MLKELLINIIYNVMTKYKISMKIELVNCMANFLI